MSVQNIKLPRKYDRRVKLSDKQRKEIAAKYNKGTCTYKKLAEEYHVSIRLISFVVNPEKYEIAKEQYRLRSKDGRYKQSPEVYIQAQKRLKDYKIKLLTNGKISYNK